MTVPHQKRRAIVLGVFSTSGGIILIFLSVLWFRLGFLSEGVSGFPWFFRAGLYVAIGLVAILWGITLLRRAGM